MKNIRIIISTAICAATLSLVGCSSNPTNAQVGTGVGAVAGGLVGNAVFGNTIGTVGGAAAGALIGNQVGRNHDYDRRGYGY
ncbi:glycine zipper 2TM domain-containing protein [Diaphorobacter aerolatus]|uniref:Glycine zipper 2TM domain-containing protein n=1 Tax=Diaphorobacter aerolatus TaxID=1288495 RepID=A0A7H0GIG4_9BURK|nr:glycine zipper domain-containing protein [Diaphorobacter aerolatus]QNP48080.1 glycine zipper 2TM domain-containing protein [Diaphorobacter aerolatus]